MEKSQSDRAERVLAWLYEGTAEAGSVARELRSITADIAAKSDSRRSTLSLTLSLFSERPLRARLWRAFLLQFLAQMCGAAAMKYYLPSLLQALGLGRRLALMAGAMEMTVKIAMSVVEMWLIDRLGRKACVVGGSAVMGVAMLVSPSSHIWTTQKKRSTHAVLDQWCTTPGISRKCKQGVGCRLRRLHLCLRHGL